MSLFTHWACFDCRKSFSKEAVSSEEPPRICPECRNPMTDMGRYFAAPRKLDKKRWEIMKLLAENGYKFYSPESKNHIQNFILQARNPRIADVEERILLDKQSQSDS